MNRVALIMLLPILVERVDPLGIRPWLERTAHSRSGHPAAQKVSADRDESAE